MFRLNKIKKTAGTLTAAVIFAAGMLWPANVCHAQKQTEVPAICGEDEYVLLSCGNNYAEIYNSQGEYEGRCRAYMQEGFFYAATIGKEGLISYSDGKNWNVFSMAAKKDILQVPQSCDLQCYKGVCMVSDKETGEISLYDNKGTLLYTGEGFYYSEENGYVTLRVMDSGYIVGVCSDIGDNDPVNKLPVWISADGSLAREITDEYLARAFVQGKISAFGDFLEKYDWDTGWNAVYDMDGTMLLDQIVYDIYPYVNDSNRYDYDSDAGFLAKNDQGILRIYDRNLCEITSFPFDENSYPAYANGFFRGMSYEELSGNVCTDFVRYKGEEWIPCARVDGGVWLYEDGSPVFISLSEGENITELNDAYAVTTSYDDAMYMQRLYDRNTGQILYEADLNQGSVRYELGKDYCLIGEFRENDETFTILDNQQQTCYSSHDTYGMVWKNGCLAVKRGIYNGITDKNGNWIIKTVTDYSE